MYSFLKKKNFNSCILHMLTRHFFLLFYNQSWSQDLKLGGAALLLVAYGDPSF